MGPMLRLKNWLMLENVFMRSLNVDAAHKRERGGFINSQHEIAEHIFHVKREVPVVRRSHVLTCGSLSNQMKESSDPQLTRT
jgi:hypothetical protein